ncbi:19134_t:CDS:2, partial [Racocetra fulgida]
NDDELSVDDDDNGLMDELQTDIEVFNFSNMLNLEEYINYSGNFETGHEKEVDSMEIYPISHQEALNAIEILEQYIVQKDFSKTAQFEHNNALLKLQKKIRKLCIAAFKQTNIEMLKKESIGKDLYNNTNL